MHGPDMSEALWLGSTNAGLGLVIVVCVLAIAGGVAREILRGWKERTALTTDTHAFTTKVLGVTMADGGERIEGDGWRPPGGR